MRLPDRSVAVVVLALPLCVAASACELAVNNYGGVKVEMTLARVPETPVFGDPSDPRRLPQHVELWARDGETAVVRLNPADGVAYALVPAVSKTDPCMIDTDGNLLWKKEAQQDCFGHPCADDAERERSAQSVLRRIDQLTIEQGVFLVMVAWDDAAAGPLRPAFDEDMPARERLAACRRYWDASPFVYSGNPFQLTAPVHGILYGAVDFFSTTRLAQIAGGIQILSNYGLRDVRELFLTQTPAKITEVNVDVLECGTSGVPRCRGRVMVQGNRAVLGRGTFHFELTSPVGAGSGAATIYANLDEDPVQF